MNDAQTSQANGDLILSSAYTNMLTSDFDYHLPQHLIAQSPAQPRDSSRLLLLNRQTGAIQHSTFSNLPDHLREGDLLVLNDSRVVPARLLGRRADHWGQGGVDAIAPAGRRHMEGFGPSCKGIAAKRRRW